jgi:nicotinate-nucleotide adenylyltransferase
MSIGIYGGTFDPPHYGHLNLALEMAEIHHLKEVWFCPAKINPHKIEQEQEITPVAHRLEMVQLAIAGIPNFQRIDIEAYAPGYSYTVETLRQLQQQFPDKKFSFIIGDDAISRFFQWREPEQIIQLATLLVGRRSSTPLDMSGLQGDPAICEAIRKGMTQTRLLEISGTEIRRRLSLNRYCKHLAPPNVIDYICHHHLYSGV